MNFKTINSSYISEIKPIESPSSFSFLKYHSTDVFARHNFNTSSSK